MTKKLLLIGFMISVFMISGCSTNQNTKEELSEEVLAEMEEESQITEIETTEGQISEIKPEETNSEGVISEETISGEKIDNETTVNVEEEKELLTFSEVYDETHLVEPLEYFIDSYKEFEEGEKVVFAEEYITEFRRKIANYDLSVLRSLSNDVLYEVPFLSGLNYDEYYTYYSVADNIINVELLDGEFDKVIDDVLEDDLLILAATFWASEGYVQAPTFTAIIDPEYYNSFNKLAQVVDYRQIDEYVLWSEIEYYFDPIHVNSNVLINEKETIELFEDEDIRKVELYLPVKDVIGTFDFSVDEEGNSSEVEFDDKVLEGFVNEIIYEDYVDFSKYSAVVAPMYLGNNSDVLDHFEVTINGSINTMYSLALFGQYENVTLYFYEDMNSNDEPYSIDVGSIKNGYLSINVDVIPSVSRLSVNADVITKYGEETSFAVNFYDDVVPEEYYSVIMFE